MDALDIGQQLDDPAEDRVGAGSAHLNLQQTVERDRARRRPGCPVRRLRAATRR